MRACATERANAPAHASNDRGDAARGGRVRPVDRTRGGNIRLGFWTTNDMTKNELQLINADDQANS